MYADPRHLHDREIKARFDERTFDLIEAAAAFAGKQRAALVRAIAEQRLAQVVGMHGGTEQIGLFETAP